MSVAQKAPAIVVVDASFVLRYVLHTAAPKPHPDGLGLFSECELVVPSIWCSEIASALVQAERRGAATAAKVGEALAHITALNPVIDTLCISVARNLELARAYGLTPYDALYVELAIRRNAALASCDLAMCTGALSAGIRLYPPPLFAS